MKRKKVGSLIVGVMCAMLLAACNSQAASFNEEGLAKYQEGSYSEAVTCFGKAIAADNQNLEYHVNKGMAYLELGDYDNARSCFDAAIGQNKKYQAAYRGNGIACMETGDYEAAVEAFDAALACKSGRVTDAEFDILLYRGEAQTRMGDYDGAIDTYTVLLETQGELARTYYLRGVAYVKSGNTETGMADMDKAISLGKTDYSMYLNSYYCLADAGQADLGVKYLRDALMIDEKAKPSHKARGTVHFLLEDYSSALTEFEYEKEKADVETLIYMGLCHQSLGDMTGSYEAFSRALAEGGENAEVYYQMGMCMFSTREYESALDYLNKGLELGDSVHKKEMMYTQALCYERLERFPDALKAFEEYAAQYGSDEALDKEIAFLKTR